MTHITTANTATHPFTLESVQRAFDHWRNAPGREKKIPESLWQQVAEILPHYRQKKILTTLRLNHAQLYKNLNLPSPQPLSSSPSLSQKTRISAKKQQKTVLPPPAFAKAFLPTSTDQAPAYHVEWKRPDGTQFTVTQLDTAGLRLLIENWRA